MTFSRRVPYIVFVREVDTYVSDPLRAHTVLNAIIGNLVKIERPCVSGLLSISERC